MERKVYLNISDFEAQNRELGGILPEKGNVEILKDEVTAGSLKMNNRLVCQAMEGCDSTPDGKPDELTIRRYERLARGGSGLIWYEATAVLPEGRANPRQLYIDEKNLDAFKAHVEKIKEDGLKANGFEPVVVMQATHSGRYSKPEGVPAPIIAYNNPIFEGENPIPSERIATDDYLDRVVEKLIDGAVLAEKAGFDGVDIKCCHRYLNSELLSAYERKGKYGGSLENRSRFLRESVTGAISATGSDFTVSTRMNIYDGFEYPYGFGVKPGEGITPCYDEAAEIIEGLYKAGMPIVNITMGNPYFNPHVNRPFASGGYETEEHPLTGVARALTGAGEIKKRVPGIKVICSALSYLGVASPVVASAMIEKGEFDLAGFGRMIFAYPDFANDILNKGELDKTKCCICCSKCTHIMRSGGTPGCVIKDKDVYLPIFKDKVK